MRSESKEPAVVAGEERASGGFLDVRGERYYVIRNVDRMPPFFMSVISSSDHWLFVSSTGGLTAGRVSPESALFPYIPVDRIHESGAHTGCRTILRVGAKDRQSTWEPFNTGLRRPFQDEPQSLQMRAGRQALLRGGQS